MNHFTEHSPSPQHLELRNQAPLSFPFMRIGGALIVLAMLSYGVLAYHSGVALVHFVGPVAMVSLIIFAFQVGFPPETRVLTFDAATRSLILRERGFFFFFSRTRRFGPGDLYAIGILVDAEKPGADDPLLNLHL
ncbi:MAG: hypothetical protein ACNA8W_23250, partial [Bradymonadaceae bacterium]